MSPTIGRIVVYNTAEQDRIAFGVSHGNVQSKLPAIITAVWSDECVNLKVIGDGPTDLWKTSVTRGPGEYQWDWPEIKK